MDWKEFIERIKRWLAQQRKDQVSRRVSRKDIYERIKREQQGSRPSRK